MTETSKTGLDVDAITARLSEIEAERDALLATLASAHAEIAAVLSCYPTSTPVIPPPPEKAPKKSRAPNVSEGAITDAIGCVRNDAPQDADPKALAAAVRKGLVVRRGRGKNATYSVAE